MAFMFRMLLLFSQDDAKSKPKSRVFQTIIKFAPVAKAEELGVFPLIDFHDIDVVKNETQIETEDSVILMQLQQTIRTQVEQLPHKYQIILGLRYGLYDGRMHARKEIDNLLSLPKGTAKRLEQQALTILRNPKTIRLLRDFLQ